MASSLPEDTSISIVSIGLSTIQLLGCHHFKMPPFLLGDRFAQGWAVHKGYLDSSTRLCIVVYTCIRIIIYDHIIYAYFSGANIILKNIESKIVLLCAVNPLYDIVFFDG